MAGRPIVHIEIPAADPQAAAQFYGEAFGWKSEHVPDMDYSTFEFGNGGGGFPKLSDMCKPGDVMLYISSEDIEADLECIQGLGARTVVPKTEIPNMGWFAIFSDPTGNRVGLFQELGQAGQP